MPQRTQLSRPTISALSSSIRLPCAHPAIFRTLIKLSRPLLISLVLEWLQPHNQPLCSPYLAGDDFAEDDTLYPPAQTLDELRELYQELKTQKGSRRDVLDRVVEGDWRHGLSLQQLAMADVQHLQDSPTSQRWTALKLVRTAHADGDNAFDLQSQNEEPGRLPHFHAPTFLRNLQNEIKALVKAHYYLTRMPSMPISLLRIQVHDSPYNSQLAFLNSTSKPVGDASKIIYVAFPDYTPTIYISQSATQGKKTGVDAKELSRIVIDALPKAFSRPLERYTLRTTSLSTHSLSVLVNIRGPGRENVAAGAWSMFTEGSVEKSPLLSAASESEHSYPDDEKENLHKPLLSDLDEPKAKKRKLVAESRFGQQEHDRDGKGIEKLSVRVEDPFPGDGGDISREADESTVDQPPKAIHAPRRGRRSALSMLDDLDNEDSDDVEVLSSSMWRPNVQLSFRGSNVFVGIRKLVESGAVNGQKIPGWMTGENGVSVGVVRDGRIRGNKGSSL